MFAIATAKGLKRDSLMSTCLGFRSELVVCLCLPQFQNILERIVNQKVMFDMELVHLET